MTLNAPIVVCGESLLDVFQQAPTATGLQLEAVVGGSPLNVAMGLARLGRPVEFFGAVSRDFLGERIARTIAEEGIGRRALRRSDAPTTLSLVGLDARGVPSYRFYGEGGADRQLRVEDLAALPEDIAALHFGSYACVVPPIDATLQQLVLQRRARSVIAYDPNVRLNVQPDRAVWRQRLDWMAAHCHLLKLSDEDFDRLYPGEAADAFAQRLLAAGVQLVLMTRGGQGALAWHAAGRCEVDAPRIEVCDTVGAGDTFQAATLAALAETGRLSPAGLAALTLDELRRIAAFAAAAAAITCTRRGPDLPRRAELPAQI